MLDMSYRGYLICYEILRFKQVRIRMSRPVSLTAAFIFVLVFSSQPMLFIEQSNREDTVAWQGPSLELLSGPV
jgi:hypothetical protein